MSIFSIIIFLIILLVLVFVHELGHFLTAKWVNMRVDEFAFGFPPRLFSKKVGETKYSLNAIPLGGYVSIWGETGEVDDEARGHKRAFGNRPKWAQLLVLIAGVFMNMLLAFLIFIFTSYGNVSVSTSDPEYGARTVNKRIVVIDAHSNSPAQMIGLTAGSVITEVKSNGQKADLSSSKNVISFIERNNLSSFDITFISDKGEKIKTTISPVYGIIEGKRALGISIDQMGDIETSFWEATKISWMKTKNITYLTIFGVKDLLSSLFKGENVLSSLSGPIGIAKIVDGTSSYGLSAILNLTAILSINLAIFNILPLPALDGGRIVIVLFEAVSRRKVPFKYYSWLNVVSFLALMALLIVVTIHDVIK